MVVVIVQLDKVVRILIDNVEIPNNLS